MDPSTNAFISARRREIVARKLSLQLSTDRSRAGAAGGCHVAVGAAIGRQGGLALYYRGANSLSGAAGAAIRTRPSVAVPARYPERQPMGAGRCLRPGGAAPSTAAGLGWRDNARENSAGRQHEQRVHHGLQRANSLAIPSWLVVSFMRLGLVLYGAAAAAAASEQPPSSCCLWPPFVSPGCLPACSPTADSEGYLCE
ncbi:hypothetical protein TgHK011_007251 [Trichoderma gracile]|nr:hypothetical protein TgHK011_007251 [Trichoderma gracile]